MTLFSSASSGFAPLAWSVAQQVGRQVIAVVAFLVIALYISAADLGLMGIAMIWIGFLNVFADLGFSAALVQRPELTSKHVTSAFYLNVAVALILASLSAAFAGPVAAMLESPDGGPVIRWLSISFVFTALSTVQNALAQRSMRFSALAVRDTTATAAGAIVGVALAVRGWGVWSLVVQTLVASATATLLLWTLSTHRFAIRDCSMEAARDLWRFGVRITTFGLFKYVVRNVDALCVGYFLGLPALGLYMFAQRVVLQPMMGIEAGIGTFVFASAAASQHDRQAVKRVYLASFDLLNALLVAWALVVSIAGPTLLALYFPSQWHQGFPLLWMLAIILVTHAPTTATGQVMKALNHPGWLLWWSVGMTTLAVTALAIGLPWGLQPALLGMAAIHAVSLVYIALTARRHLDVSFGEWLSVAARAYGAAVVLIAVAAASRLLLDEPVAIASVFIVLVGLTLALAMSRSALHIPLVKNTDALSARRLV